MARHRIVLLVSRTTCRWQLTALALTLAFALAFSLAIAPAQANPPAAQTTPSGTRSTGQPEPGEGDAVQTAPAEFNISPFEARKLPAGVGKVVSDRHNRESIHAKVFLHGPAIIRERRNIGLPDGRVRLLLQDIPKQIDPFSLRIESDHNIRLISQSYTFGDLTQERLLETHIGETILIQADPQEDDTTWQRAQLLAFDPDHLILALNDKVQTVARSAQPRLAFPQVCTELHGKPTLELDIDSERGGNKTTTITYRSHGLSWKPHYQILINDQEALRLVSLARIENRSGIGLHEIGLSFIAGRDDLYLETTEFASSQAEELLSGRSYSLKLDSVEIPRANITYRFNGKVTDWQRDDRQVKAEKLLSWTAQRHLPAGRADIYTTPGMQLKERTRIPDTANGEPVVISAGRSDRITATRQRNTSATTPEDTHQWQIVIHNHTDRAKQVEVNERIPVELAKGWELIKTSIDPHRQTRNSLEWRLEVGGKQQKKVEYRVHIRRQ